MRRINLTTNDLRHQVCWLIVLTACSNVDLQNAWGAAPGPPGSLEQVPIAISRTLFDFNGPEASRRWTTVNDGVMGGRSTGRFRIEEGTLVFYGNLSLANNGGFASVRSRPANLGLKLEQEICFRVKGDGRTYSVNLYTTDRRTAFSFRSSFATLGDEWVEVKIPLSKFEATSFGRTMRNVQLDPNQVVGMGFLLGDKRSGPFELRIDWVEARDIP